MRSTKHRQDVPDLPRVPMESRTVGKPFTAPSGRVYRPSMFVTFTLPSYGRVLPDGTPADPGRYDYRRAALDALHFPKLVDRLWQNLRRATGYQVQYFAVVEPQRRLAPHLHAALRGAIPRETFRQVVAASYHQVWWPRDARTQSTTSGASRCGTGTGTSTPPPGTRWPPGTRRSTTLTPTRRPHRRMCCGSAGSSTSRASSPTRTTPTAASRT